MYAGIGKSTYKRRSLNEMSQTASGSTLNQNIKQRKQPLRREMNDSEQRKMC